MIICDKCKDEITQGEERELNSMILCDDCYLDVVWQKPPKTFYENDSAEFMRRLKDTYSILKQKFH